MPPSARGARELWRTFLQPLPACEQRMMPIWWDNGYISMTFEQVSVSVKCSVPVESLGESYSCSLSLMETRASLRRTAFVTFRAVWPCGVWVRDKVLTENKIVEGNPELHWFFCTTLYDWSLKLAPSSRPIRSCTEINHAWITLDFPRFPAFKWGSSKVYTISYRLKLRWRFVKAKILASRHPLHFLRRILSKNMLISSVQSLSFPN